MNDVQSATPATLPVSKIILLLGILCVTFCGVQIAGELANLKAITMPENSKTQSVSYQSSK